MDLVGAPHRDAEEQLDLTVETFLKEADLLEYWPYEKFRAFPRECWKVVDLDFEGPHYEDSPKLVLFMTEVRRRLHAQREKMQERASWPDNKETYRLVHPRWGQMYFQAWDCSYYLGRV